MSVEESDEEQIEERWEVAQIEDLYPPRSKYTDHPVDKLVREDGVLVVYERGESSQYVAAGDDGVRDLAEME